MHTLTHYGHHTEHELFLVGDCIITFSGKFIFPEENMSHYVIDGQEFHVHEHLLNMPGPLFFPGIPHPQAHDLPEDWQQEREIVATLLHSLIQDMHNLIGEGSAEAAIATVLAYTIHPFLQNFSVPLGKPGLWLHGPKGSGKSIIADVLMRFSGQQYHFSFTWNSSKALYERSLTSYSGIPVHIDEWRNCERRGNSKQRQAQSDIERFFINGFDGTSIAKGTPDISKSITLVTPLTVPFITGEETSNDAALLSRYIIIPSRPDTSIPRGDHPDSIFSILTRSTQYYRITRFMLRSIAQFTPAVVAHITSYHLANSHHYKSARTLENHAVIYGVLTATLALITAPDPQLENTPLQSLATWLKSQA